MANALTIPSSTTDRSHDGKAMRMLTDGHRQFVIGMLQQGVNPKACAVVAAGLGHHPKYGYELMRHEGILAAMREEATKRLAGSALVGVNVLLAIAQNPQHKDQFRAAKELAGINGFTAEQRIVVEHISEDSKAQIRQIREMAAQLGMDAGQLIKAAGIVDAEFTEVIPAKSAAIELLEVDDADW